MGEAYAGARVALKADIMILACAMSHGDCSLVTEDPKLQTLAAAFDVAVSGIPVPDQLALPGLQSQPSP